MDAKGGIIGQYLHLVLQQLHNGGSDARVPDQAALDERGQHLVLLLQWGERNLMLGVLYRLQLHQRMLDVSKWHLAIGEVVENAAKAPDITLETDLNPHLTTLGRVQVLDRFRRHEVEGAHLVVNHHAGLVRHHRRSNAKVYELQPASHQEEIGWFQILAWQN